jgi:hypothetical protein
MKPFISKYLQTIYNPRKSFKELISQDNPQKLSYIYITIPIFLYSIMYVFLTIAKGTPSALTPWLNIPKENYYAINRFLLAPSMLICWFTATSFVQVISRYLGGVGTFEGS